MEIARIYNELRQSLLLFIKSKVRNADDAEDILQNVFIKISLGISKLSEHEKLKSWVYTIARNTIIDYYRTNNVHKTIDLDNITIENMFDDEASDLTKGLDQCMHQMIGTLPEEYRQIIVDSEIRGIKQKDLAENYGLPYPTMRSRVQRGRDRLKQLFYDCCHITTDTRGNIMDVKGKGDCSGPCGSCE